MKAHGWHCPDDARGIFWRFPLILPRASFARSTRIFAATRWPARAKRYGGVAIAAVVLFLIAVAGYLYWQDRQRKQAEAATEQLTLTLQDVGANKMAAAPAQLDALRQSDAEGVKATAGLSRAALALQQGNRKLAATIYAEIAADTSLAAAVPRPRLGARHRARL